MRAYAIKFPDGSAVHIDLSEVTVIDRTFFDFYPVLVSTPARCYKCFFRVVLKSGETLEISYNMPDAFTETESKEAISVMEALQEERDRLIRAWDKYKG